MHTASNTAEHIFLPSSCPIFKKKNSLSNWCCLQEHWLIVLAWYYAGDVWVTIATWDNSMSCPEDRIPKKPSPSSGIYILSALSPMMFIETWWVDTDVLFRAENRAVTILSTLIIYVNEHICINYYPCQKEASPPVLIAALMGTNMHLDGRVAGPLDKTTVTVPS